MMAGPNRESLNHGGKMFLPASALQKLTMLHITYPMLFEISNGSQQLSTHAGVLEFTAEEGRAYLPFWLMETLHLEPGDLLQCKSTDLPLGTFIKLQPQNTNFLEISDPKAVLETAFRNFSCLSVGDMFTFSYNDTVYQIAVLEVKPEAKKSISVLETDLEVDFAPPVGYQEPQKTSGTSTPRSISSTMASKGGHMHADATMAAAINYHAIAPSATVSASSNFSGGGNRLVAKKGKANSTASTTPGASTPRSAVSISSMSPAKFSKKRAGPQPLRLPPGKLFFGYEIKPLKKKEGEADEPSDKKQYFSGEGNTLRKKK